jgi:hypothetical protein
MKRILRSLLVFGVLAGGLALCSPSAEAGPFGPFRRGGWGRYYGPGWGYRGYRPYGWGYSVYRPYGYGLGWGGYGLGYPGYGWGYRGYGWGYPAYGYNSLGIFNNPVVGGFGYPGSYGFGGYPGYYGTSISIGVPMGGFYMSSYPY